MVASSACSLELNPFYAIVVDRDTKSSAYGIETWPRFPETVVVLRRKIYRVATGRSTNLLFGLPCFQDPIINVRENSLRADPSAPQWAVD